MNTKEFIAKLKMINSKIEFFKLIENELTCLINNFEKKGYKVDKQNGFIGKQILQDDVDLFAYQYFRDVHFLYWGFKGNWNTFDRIDLIYYEKLQEIVEGLYNKID